MTVVAAPLATAQEEEDPQLARGFSIPNTRAARSRMLRAREHAQAERWNEAIEDLQVLLEENGDELIRADAEELYAGVYDLVRAELEAFPPEALALYRRRFGARAEAALDLARLRGDTRAVVEVARRWPASEAAPRAWWTLGDLELEVGNVVEARAAWARALATRLEAAAVGGAPLDPEALEDWRWATEALAERGAPLDESSAARVELARQTLDESGPLEDALRGRRELGGSLRLPGPGEAPLGAPGETASSWPQPFRIPTPHPFDRTSSHNLFPVRAADTVLFTNSLQLFAVDAYSGALRWAGPRPRGWSRLTERETRDFFKGVAVRDALIAPAASEHVAVAALQVPVTDITNETFRNIAITTIIPDRRLYAYDLETGAELWNHHPPLGWDGESGGFTERMSAAGPPVVHGSRVLVPMHRMYGRIEFYVACVDLSTGELQWSTQLVSGQRELNMFARAETEFSAPPVRVEGDSVLVLTQLGAVASLDLFSGAIRWEALYDRIPTPERNNFSASRLNNKWRNAPPVVSDGVVVAAPFDCRDLIALDLETGREVWSVGHLRIQHLAGGRGADVDVLLGADERRVFLGGWPVLALQAPGGLGREAPYQLAWRFPAGDLDDDESSDARAILLADRMVVPWRSERVEVELATGRRRSKPVPWQSGRSGNLLAEDGSLYTLDSRFLDGYFEWDTLLTRARREYEADPGAPAPTLYLARLYAQRGRAEADRGESEEARDWLSEAVTLLEPLSQAEAPSEDVLTELHHVLRAQARVHADLADGRRALAELRRARDLAPDVSELRDTLLEEYALLPGEDTEERLEVLAILEERCAPRAIVTHLIEDATREGGWRFAPIERGEPRDFGTTDVEVPLWTALERRELAARRGDFTEELTLLHRLLEEYPERQLAAGSLGEELRDAIGRRIAELGPEVYAPFERQARELYDEALATENDELLALVGEYYPHSRAARDATDTLLTWAAEQGDVEAVARHALAELPARWAPERGDERELGLLAQLGAALDAAGNRSAARAIFSTLGAVAPELAMPLESRYRGRDLASIAAELGDPPLPPLAPRADYAPGALVEDAIKGAHTFLGRVPAVSDGRAQAREVLLYARELDQRGRSVSIVAFGLPEGTDTPRKLWETPIPPREAPATWRDAVHLFPGLVVVSTSEDVYALERETGEWRWTWTARDGDVECLRGADGLVFVTTRRLQGSADVISALDSATGAELWRTEFDRLALDRRPTCGEGRVALLPRRNRAKGRVLDAFSGREVTPYELPEGVLHASITGAWIEGGLLIVPWFLSGRNPARNHLVAVDLASGEVAWDIDLGVALGGGRELRSIVQSHGITLLHLQARAGMEREGIESLLARLHTGLGALAPLPGLRLTREHRLLGVGQERRVVLDSPDLFLSSFAEGGGALRVQRVDLSSGQVRWTQRLSVTREELYNPQVRLPATGQQSVALVISTRDTNERFTSPEALLFFLDARTGRAQGNQRLTPELGTGVDISLHGLGDTLLVAGKNLLEVMR